LCRKGASNLIYATTKLKRLKILRLSGSIIALPFRLPLFILWKIGEISMFLDGLMFQSSYDYCERYIVKHFKWDEVAKKQLKINPDKFKD
jgi:hypothetical protein